jgi:hypothetical protein
MKPLDDNLEYVVRFVFTEDHFLDFHLDGMILARIFDAIGANKKCIIIEDNTMIFVNKIKYVYWSEVE